MLRRSVLLIEAFMKKDELSLMRTILNSCDDLCYIKDINGVYLYVNEAFCNRAMLTEVDIVDHDDYAIFTKEVAKVVKANDQEIMHNKKAVTIEEDGEYQGQYFCYKSNKTPLIDENGVVYGLSGVAFDYTKTKLLENEKSTLLDELKTSNETLNHLFSVISHDLKEPFNSLMTSSQLLLQSRFNIDEDTSNEMLFDINNAAKSTFYLLENLLAWSLQQMNNIEPTIQAYNIAKLVETSVAPYRITAKNKNINISISVHPETQCLLDEQIIHIVVANLINNAIKFTKKNGLIEIFTTEESNRCNIIIKDNGIGIEKHSLKNIFTIQKSSLGTGYEKGTGIGLNLCKKLIEQIGGKITLTSEIGVGTTVKITLHQHH